MANYPSRLRLRRGLDVHAARIIASNGIDYDLTACGTTVALPEADDGCVYLGPNTPITCPNCQMVINLS